MFFLGWLLRAAVVLNWLKRSLPFFFIVYFALRGFAGAVQVYPVKQNLREMCIHHLHDLGGVIKHQVQIALLVRTGVLLCIFVDQKHLVQAQGSLPPYFAIFAQQL